MVTPRENQIIDSAIAAATEEEGGDAQAKREEKEQVLRWLARIKEAREFDVDIYREMAVDRSYAAGVSAHEVSVNLIGSAIDVMKSFLYARNPEISVAPARRASLPPLIRPVAPVPPVNPMEQLSAMAAQAGTPEAPAPTLIADPNVMASVAPLVQKYEFDLSVHQQQMALYQQEELAWASEMKARRELRDTQKRFAETMDILISKSWELADLKGQCRVAVGATLTTKIGWMKLAWHEDAGLDPMSDRKLQSLQENIRIIDRLREEAKDASTENLDRVRQEIAEAIMALNSAKEVVTARGLVVDSINPEDMTVPIGVTRVTAATATAPWLAHRVFMRVDAAMTTFPDIPKEKWKSACLYSQKKPRMSIRVPYEDHPGVDGEGVRVSSASDASQFTQGPDGAMTEMCPASDGEFVCIHEVWDKEQGVVRDLCEGMPCYLRPPHAPEISVTRFYPFYSMAFVEADGLRYPQSLVQRSRGLQDEYNARRSALKRQRARAKQGILADGTALDKDEAGKIIQSVDGEITFIDTIGGKPIQNIFMEKPVVRLDPALYEVDSIRRDFEEMWGIQQALQGGIQREQTATEAEIQSQGFSTRTAFMREPLEAMLNEMAPATAEILLQRLSIEDAKEYAGPGAVWPEAASVSDLATLVSVQIKAGSTGKPNLSSERNAWAQTFPMLAQSIEKIGGLRGATPQEVADKLEQVVAITLELSGSSIDVESIVPQESMPTEQPMPPPEMAGGGMTPPAMPTGPGPIGPPGPGPTDSIN